MLAQLLLIASFACGPFAIWMAARKSFGAAFAMIVIGVAAGVGGLAESLNANRLQFEELRRSGQQILNDMPGFGQALLFAMGVVYFGAVLLLATGAALWRSSRTQGQNK